MSVAIIPFEVAAGALTQALGAFGVELGVLDFANAVQFIELLDFDSLYQIIKTDPTAIISTIKRLLNNPLTRFIAGTNRTRKNVHSFAHIAHGQSISGTKRFKPNSGDNLIQITNKTGTRFINPPKKRKRIQNFASTDHPLTNLANASLLAPALKKIRLNHPTRTDLELSGVTVQVNKDSTSDGNVFVKTTKPNLTKADQQVVSNLISIKSNMAPFTRKRRTRRRPGHNTKAHTMGVSNKKLVELKDCFAGDLGSANTVPQVQNIILNQMQTRAPLGWNQWEAFYKKYTVIYARMKITFINDSAEVQNVGVILGDIAASPTSLIHACQLSNKHAMLGAAGSAKDSISWSFNINLTKLLGRSHPLSDSEMTAVVTTNPASTPSMSAWAVASDGAGATTDVKFTFDMVFGIVFHGVNNDIDIAT